VIESYDFVKAVLDTASEGIVVIDSDGDIQFANHSWDETGRVEPWFEYGGWKGINYLKVCDEAGKAGDSFALRAAKGIRKVSRAEQDLYYLEYPCHSPLNQRWFMMRVSQFILSDTQFLVISHRDITEKKLAEQEVSKLTSVDDITGIPNRRVFGEFLDQQWVRAVRMKTPISLARLDIDHFKKINDTYGRTLGDGYLRSLGDILSKSANRPDDICARYGGDEFTILLGGTEKDGARSLMLKLLRNIRALKIPNEQVKAKPILTLSIGLAEIYPNKNNKPEDLLLAANKLLYAAKDAGRDSLAVTESVLKSTDLGFKIYS